jgi:hypothetical protein
MLQKHPNLKRPPLTDEPGGNTHHLPR